MAPLGVGCNRVPRLATQEPREPLKGRESLLTRQVREETLNGERPDDTQCGARHWSEVSEWPEIATTRARRPSGTLAVTTWVVVTARVAARGCNPTRSAASRTTRRRRPSPVPLDREKASRAQSREIKALSLACSRKPGTLRLTLSKELRLDGTNICSARRRPERNASTTARTPFLHGCCLLVRYSSGGPRAAAHTAKIMKYRAAESTSQSARPAKIAGRAETLRPEGEGRVGV